MPKNYYVILGIPTNSSLREIKTAYRRLAKEYHPDYYGHACSPFPAIQEAYTILSNPKQRLQYDNTLRSVRSKPAKGRNCSAARRDAGDKSGTLGPRTQRPVAPGAGREPAPTG